MTTPPDQVLFAHIVGKAEDDLDLGAASLVLGEFQYPDLDVAHYVSLMDHFAELATELRPEEGADNDCRALEGLNRALFERLGFRGNREDYYDPKNSFLNEVIDRRLGIPITLAVLYVEVGRRVGLRLAGLNFPGHFLVRQELEDGDFRVVDPFSAGALVRDEELGTRLQNILGPEARLGEEQLVPARKRQILSRILSNLAAIYRRGGDVYRHIAVLERMLILDPDNPRLEGELHQLRRRAEELN